MPRIIKYIISTIILAFLIFLIFSFIDLITAERFSSAPGIFTGCFSQGVRTITFFLFPIKEPVQCIWRTKDALINLPYHLLIGSVIIYFWYRLRKKKATSS